MHGITGVEEMRVVVGMWELRGGMDATRGGEKEEERASRSIQKYCMQLSPCSWVQGCIIRIAWCILRNDRIIMVYFKIDEL